jgi:signal transduction histidine kinase
LALPRGPVALLALVLIAAIALGDHLTGSALSFTLLYALPIASSAWLVSPRFGYALAGLSVVLWLVGDLFSGEPSNHPLVVAWNASIRLICYGGFVWLVDRLHRSQESLEQRVKERTAALERQNAERQRLQDELLAISERERRAFGHDLHDSICQHLTATALAGQVVAQKLANQGLPEARHARKVVGLIEAAIAQSRSLARGLSPVDLNPDGLRSALEELAATTGTLFGVSCTASCDETVRIADSGMASQLFCIAQEAVRNAVRHGKARHVHIDLVQNDDALVLRVEDDGKGLPQPLPANGGMGLRIMSHRASAVGAVFRIVPRPAGGTVVECVMAVVGKHSAVNAPEGKLAYG